MVFSMFVVDFVDEENQCNELRIFFDQCQVEFIYFMVIFVNFMLLRDLFFFFVMEDLWEIDVFGQ